MKSLNNPISLASLLETAHQLRQAEHQALEEGKLGSYRAGNTGILLGTKYLGKCPRKSLLRSVGVESEDNDAAKHIMFSGGRLNESVWLESLKLAYPWDILCEEEIPTSWKTEDGTTVSGRPDMVLLDEGKQPMLGLELKMASSVWTVRDVLLQNLPKFDHLAQAAHYMWQLDIPFKLCYTSYVDYPVVGWMQKRFPQKGEPGSEYCEYNDKLDEKTGKRNTDIKKVRPFTRIYDLRFDSLTGVLQYTIEGQNRWTTTVVSIEGIQNYFNGLDKAQKGDILPPRPDTVNPDGQKDGWSICDYCPLNYICQSNGVSEKSLQKWIKRVEEELKKKEDTPPWE